MATKDFLYELMRKTIEQDKTDKIWHEAHDKKPKPARSREKNIVGEGKAVRKGEATGSRQKVSGGNETQAAPRQALRRFIDIAEDVGPEKMKKMADTTARRRRQKTREEIASIYRENHMDPEAYQNWQDKVYGRKRR